MNKKRLGKVCAWLLAGILTAECFPASFVGLADGKNGSAEKQAEAAQIMTVQTEQSREQGSEQVSSMKNRGLEAEERSRLLPTEEEMKQWQEDGSLEKRQAFMESIGMQSASLKELSQEAVSSLGLDEDYPTVWTEGMPTTGNVKSLVFLVDFPDMPNDGTTPEDVEAMLFSGEDTESPEYPYESLSAYYKRSSYGKLNISGDVYGWLTMAHEREYYNGEDAEAGRQEMIQEILNAYDDEIDFSQYDSDKDGMVDSIYIYYAGGTTGWGEQWWSYVVTSPEAWEFADGIKLKKYCFFGDMSTATAIHETGHLLHIFRILSSGILSEKGQ